MSLPPPATTTTHSIGESNSTVIHADEYQAALQLGYKIGLLRRANNGDKEAQCFPQLQEDFAPLLIRLIDAFRPNTYATILAAEDRAREAFNEYLENNTQYNFTIFSELLDILCNLYTLSDKYHCCNLWFEIGERLFALSKSQYDLSRLVCVIGGPPMSLYEAAKATFRAANPLACHLSDSLSGFDLDGYRLVQELIDVVRKLPVTILTTSPTLSAIASSAVGNLISDESNDCNAACNNFATCYSEANQRAVSLIYLRIENELQDLNCDSLSGQPSSHSQNRKSETGGKGGRPKKTEDDKELLMAWETKQYRTHADLGRAKGIPKSDTVKHALARARKHRKNMRLK